MQNTTPAPRTDNEQCAEYDQATVGSYIHYFGGWHHEEGTVVRATDWQPATDVLGNFPFRADERERLIVVAHPETATDAGTPLDGGYALINVKRWTDTPRSMAGERGLGDEREGHYVEVLASTGIRYTGTVDEFLTAVDRTHEAWQQLDRAIAETDMDNPARTWR